MFQGVTVAVKQKKQHHSLLQWLEGLKTLGEATQPV